MSAIPVVGLLWGEGRGADFARFWLAAPVASDDGVAWAIRPESNDVTPAGLGGEAVFSACYLTVRAAAGAVLRLTPIVNDVDQQVQTLDWGTVTIVQPRLTIPQQLGSPAPMLTQTFAVPLVQRVEVSGSQFVSYLRGERLRIRLDSIGAIGSGALRVEQCEVEYELIRRSHFSTFTE